MENCGLEELVICDYCWASLNPAFAWTIKGLGWFWRNDFIDVAVKIKYADLFFCWLFFYEQKIAR